MGIIFTDPATTGLKLPPILEAFKAIKPTKPAILAALDEGAPFDAAGIEELRQLGVPCFPSPERALRALARVTAHGRREFRRAPAHARSKPLPSLDQGTMAEYRSKEVLKSFGIPFPEGGMARNVFAQVNPYCGPASCFRPTTKFTLRAELAQYGAEDDPAVRRVDHLVH